MAVEIGHPAELVAMTRTSAQGRERSRQEQAEALLRAFAERDLGAIGDLLEAGCDLDARVAGLTVLMRAVLRDDPVAMEWMLAAGADPDAKSSDGKRAIDLAREIGRGDLAELLTLAGAEDDDAPEIEAPAVKLPAEARHPLPAQETGRVFADWIDDRFEDRFEDRFDDRFDNRLEDPLPAWDAVEEELSSELVATLDGMEGLDDGDLWRLARETMPRQASRELEALHFKRQDEGLDPAEDATRAKLIQEYERTILIRAQAAKLLKERGHDVSGLVAAK